MVKFMSAINRIEILKRNNIKKIEAMKLNPVVVNNHTGEEEEITGLVEFVNPEKGLACCFNARYYSLNACVIQDSKLHCSTMAIGGVLWGAYPDSEQLTKYNNDQLFDGGKIKCIYRPDGSIVYPLVREDEPEEEGIVEEAQLSAFAAFFVNKINEERNAIR
jgi:hypothetical protein